MSPPKLTLAHAPTPLFRHDALDALVGTRVWVKRDDMTGGPEAGNKIRKLEYLLADAIASGAKAVITCGGAQSNHARATAVLARRLSLRPVLLLRTHEKGALDRTSGNALLDALCGAELRAISPAQYRERDTLMQELADELNARGEPAYVIPEGGSNALGALGYVDAMREVREQMDRNEADAPARFDAVVHACGSGGTAVGTALGAALYSVAPCVLAMAVCDDAAYFERKIQVDLAGAWKLLERAPAPTPFTVLDAYKGPGYAVATAEQLRFIGTVARACGLIVDPVYTGKALFGLSQLAHKPERALFLHTGGLPGLIAQGAAFEAHIDTPVIDMW